MIAFGKDDSLREWDESLREWMSSLKRVNVGMWEHSNVGTFLTLVFSVFALIFNSGNDTVQLTIRLF